MCWSICVSMSYLIDPRCHLGWGILHVICAIYLRRFGVDRGPIASMLETLQFMSHTTWGICEGYGADDSTFPLQEILQGNGAGPCIWLVISVKLMRKERVGMFLTTPVTK